MISANGLVRFALARRRRRAHLRAMGQEQHRAWIAELAAADKRRRRQAEPGLAQKEAALKAARLDLARTDAAVQDLAAELDDARLLGCETASPAHGDAVAAQVGDPDDDVVGRFPAL